MPEPFDRRRFLKTSAGAGFLLGSGDLAFLLGLPPVSAAQSRIEPSIVRFDPEIEPWVRLLEETERDRLLEEVALRIKRGGSYREVLTALLLAGIRNIQPRPTVGSKFHAVLVIHSAHLASLASSDLDRWLPIFWALDQFKVSQAQDVEEGDWTLGTVNEAAVPPSAKAPLAFADAMDAWDESAADVAAAGLARGVSPREVFELLCRYAARDFRSLGHKAIYVANGWRTLELIGWRHAEPVLRSIAYALLTRGGTDPLRGSDPADQPWRKNLHRASQLRSDWHQGRIDSAVTSEMLAVLRQGSHEQTSREVIELVNHGSAPQSVWDAIMLGAAELLMNQPNIVSLHAVTMTNALRYLYEASHSEATRRLLLLQNAAFIHFFQEKPLVTRLRIDQLRPADIGSTGRATIEEILSDVDRNRERAARKLIGYLKTHSDLIELMDAARRLVFLKGREAHDYKFSSAVFEDYAHVSPSWRSRYLATIAFHLRGPASKNSELVSRTRAALGAT